MANDYIPRSDVDCCRWLNGFSKHISKAPLSFGVKKKDASLFSKLTEAFSVAFMTANRPTTRTPVAVVVKNMARTKAELFARRLALIIQANPDVTPLQLQRLGLTVRKKSKKPVKTPTTYPIVTVTHILNREHHLRYRDSSDGKSKFKPVGATSLLLNVWIAPIGSSVTGAPKYMQPASRNPIIVRFDADDLGKMATYQARWVTRKGAMGPLSNLVSAVIG